MENRSDIGVLGLGPMGRNLALNCASKGFCVSVYNWLEAGEEHVVDDFIHNNAQKGVLLGFTDLESFVASLKVPRKILIMVKAGKSVENVIERLIPFMDGEEIIIDGGNSHYEDTSRRVREVGKCGVRYIGCGISGGWHGALHGPSMMPGGAEDGWHDIKDLFRAIAAKDDAGVSCCDWIGPEGAGHFVKMVHNGIEYAQLQIIAEAYDMMRRSLQMPNKEIVSLFQEWNEGIIGSYLMEITGTVLALEESNGKPLIENVLDFARQKGTGKDIAICALKHGVVASTITEAVNARFLSGSEHRRIEVSREKTNKSREYQLDKIHVVPKLFDCVYCAQLIAIAQGLELIGKVSEAQSWNLDIQRILAVWGKGCILESGILRDIRVHLKKNSLNNILMEEISGSKLENFTQAVSLGIQSRIPQHVCSAALAYYQALTSPILPANLIQLQREYFGSHGFEKKNNPGTVCHFKR